jgi:hypothetical protein
MSRLELRFRQVHLDFHTSPDIQDIGADFDAEEFASTLEKARVDSITCFARCHHGYLYYDSKAFPELVHPHLVKKNLLQEQIEACRRRGIRVPIYITVQWDDYMARHHPEWLAVDEAGAPLGAPFPKGTGNFEPGFYRTLCLNSPYRDYLKKQTLEVLETFDPVDGIFFDIVFVNECSCAYCLKEMEHKGYNPVFREDRIRYSSDLLDDFIKEMSALVREHHQEASIFYNRSHISSGHRKIDKSFTHFELESLPSGSWGYMHFPITIRFARNLGLDCLGQTGKFQTEWGDFHSFKNKAALEYECFRMLALNAKCMIGDQLEPNGKLSAPVYELIGSVYEQVEKKESWCIGAKAVTDIGVFTPEEHQISENFNLPSETIGVSRMLTEGGHQFDIIDSQSEFSHYKVLILPDSIPVSPSFADKLRAYLDQGGAIIASFESGLNLKKTGFEMEEFGVILKENQTKDIYGEPVKGKIYDRFDYADYLLPNGRIATGLPETEHAMYIKGLEVQALPGTEVLAKAILPYFNRNYKHYISHRQTPSSGKPGYDGIVQADQVIYFAHPIFTQYNQNAPKWCKQMVLNALDILLPKPVLKHSGPSTVMAAVNEQTAENRWVAHLLHYIPERRSVEIDIVEDIIPIYQLRVSVNTTKPVKQVMLVPEKKPVDFIEVDGRIEFVVPEVAGHQMVSIDFN